MVTRIKNGEVFSNGRFEKRDLYFEDEKICSERKYDKEIDADGCRVCAGFVDIHCHGGGGADFADGDVDGNVKAAMTHLCRGTTSLFPTVTSVGYEKMKSAAAAIDAARRYAKNLRGIHLEGPYLSPAQTGAQNSGALSAPDIAACRSFLSEYEIARWDYAPELDADLSFLDMLNSYGIVAAAAHTDATCADIERAARHGCKLITHLYSCTSTVKRKNGFRIAGTVEAAYLVDDISVEIIADGCHLPPELIRLVCKLKGVGKTALVTDAMRAAGLGDSGEYDIGGVRCFIEDGVAKLPDRSAFAGSIATADRLVRTCVSSGIPLADALIMMTETPARIMGLKKKGRVDIGYDADIVIFDDNINIKKVILAGEIV